MAVKDKRAWNDWVDGQVDAIRSHSVLGKEDSLVGRIRQLSRPPTGRFVEEAFSFLARPLLPEQDAVIEDRNTVAHTALMITDGAYNFQRELGRIALVRSMLIALIGLAIGYRGQIRGWQHPNIGDGTPPAEWWPVDPEDEAVAAKWYRAAYPAEDVAK